MGDTPDLTWSAAPIFRRHAAASAKLMDHEILFASHAPGLAPCLRRGIFTVLIGGKIMTDQIGKSHYEVADYISTVTAQLAQMAASDHYTTLAHVLEMAWLESEQLCGRDSVTPRRHYAGG
jgi:hypothetical protein